VAQDKYILSEVKKYFDIRELVGKRTYKKYGESAWKFLDIRLLETILIVRKNIKRKVYINNWHKKGKFSQRGLRTNVQQIFRSKFLKDRLYISAHVLGKAVDFIKSNYLLFPYKVRLEAGVSWVHLDIISEDKNPRVYVFNP
jgi:hypothetical protein